MIVVDASVVAPALGNDDEEGRAARRRLLDRAPLHAPHLLDLEVLSVWRRDARAGRLTDDRARKARSDLVSFGATRHGAALLTERIWALRENLSAYDAAYVALAEALGCALVTSDQRLAGAPGPRCPIEVL